MKFSRSLEMLCHADRWLKPAAAAAAAAQKTDALRRLAIKLRWRILDRILDGLFMEERVQDN